MDNIILCYGGTSALPVSQIAETVGFHLNFLGTGQGDIQLSNVRQIIIEDADQVVVSSQFPALQKLDSALATSFVRNAIHQAILAVLVYKFFDEVKWKINAIAGQYSDKDKNTVFFDVSQIRGMTEKYREAVRTHFGKDDVFHFQDRSKGVLKQVVEPRLDDLSFSLAKFEAGVTDQFRTAANERSSNATEIKNEISDMEKRLSDLIQNKKP